MTNESSYKAFSSGKALFLQSVKPAKRVFIKQSLFYGGAAITLYLLTGLALRIFGVA